MQVGERVDDRNVGLSLELRHVRVVVNARQEQAVEPGQNLNDPTDRTDVSYTEVIFGLVWFGFHACCGVDGGGGAGRRLRVLLLASAVFANDA